MCINVKDMTHLGRDRDGLRAVLHHQTEVRVRLCELHGHGANSTPDIDHD